MLQIFLVALFLIKFLIVPLGINVRGEWIGVQIRIEMGVWLLTPGFILYRHCKTVSLTLPWIISVLQKGGGYQPLFAVGRAFLPYVQWQMCSLQGTVHTGDAGRTACIYGLLYSIAGLMQSSPSPIPFTVSLRPGFNQEKNRLLLHCIIRSNPGTLFLGTLYTLAQGKGRIKNGRSSN